MKNFRRRVLSWVLAVAMFLTLLPVTSLTAYAAAVPGSLTDPSIGISLASSTGSWNASGTTITGSVTGTTTLGIMKRTATNTLTITNTKNKEAELSFDYSFTLNGGNVVIDGTTVTTTPGTFSKPLAANATVKIQITSASGAGNTTSISLTHLQLVSNDVYETTFAPGEHGSFKVDGENIIESTTKTTTDAGCSLVATPESGYKFIGWYSQETDTYLSYDATFTYVPSINETVAPVFVVNGTPVFDVTEHGFSELNDAIAYAQANNAKKITLVSDGTIAGDYVIPSGITLLIPFDSAYTMYTNKPGIKDNSFVRPTAYKTLTLAENTTITVNGAISVSAMQTSGAGSQNYAGSPSGPYGYIKMSSGSNMIFNSGSYLYCWGYISGDGLVSMKSGSTVYEDMQIGDFRGGTASSGLASSARGKAFVFNQYFVQNVESEMVIESGATEKLYTSLYASSKSTGSEATFIGNNGMFKVSDGTFTKRYNPQTDRLEVSVNGDATIDSITVTVGVSVTSGSYVLPIMNNLTLNVNSGTTHITQDVAMMTGVEVNIAEDATLDITTNSDVFVYDTDEWSTTFTNGGYKTVPYSPTKKASYSSTIKDAKIDVNGTVNVSGKIYTTTGGANICSSNGTGVIKLNNGVGTATLTYQPDGTTGKVASIPITAAKLHNGCADPAYTETAGSKAGTVYTYNAEKDMWETSIEEITITFDANDGMGTMEDITVEEGKEITLPDNAFTKDGYIFKNWSANADGTGVVYENGVTVAFDADTTLYAQWEKNTSEFTVTWIDEDGTVLDTETYEEGETPVYKGETPAKAADAQYNYEFAGWTPEVVEVTADTTYKATYKDTTRTYIITWVDEDGSQLAQITVPYGETPVYPNADPVKEADDENMYHFAGWKNGETGIVPVTGNATYTAAYESEIRSYTITWDVGGNTETEIYEYGATPFHEDPVKEATAQYTYTFMGWAPEIGSVKGDQTYTANFEETLRSYTVTWKNADGTVLSTEEVTYGTDAVYSGETPVKAEDDENTYEFTGWDKEPTAVTGDVIYTAQFKAIEKIKYYTITWMSDDETVLKTDVVEAGIVPAYGETDPVKEGDAQYSYTFTGWDKEIVAAEADAAYTAKFSQTTNKYTIKFMNADTVLQEMEVEYGQMPEYTGSEPTKTGDDHFYYTFAGWDKEIAEVTEDAVYSANFEVHTNTYTVTWADEDGTIFAIDENVEYGTMPVFAGENPVKEGYVFVGWTPAVTPVGEDITYTAVFEEEVKITVRFASVDPNNAESITYLSGAVIEDGVVVKQAVAKSFIGYEFKGWNVSCGEFSEDALVPAGRQLVTDEALNEVIARCGGTDILVTAIYEKSESVYSLIIKYNINGEALEGFTSDDYAVGQAVRVTASDTYKKDGKEYVFDHWLVGKNELAANSISLRSNTPTTITVTACYVEGEVVVQPPTVGVVNRYGEIVNDVAKIALTLTYNVPEGNSMGQVGFVISTKESVPTIENASKSTSKLTSPSGTYTVHINVDSKRDKNVYARAYLTYIDGSTGETVTIYSAPASYKWTDLSNQ